MCTLLYMLKMNFLVDFYDVILNDYGEIDGIHDTGKTILNML